MWLKKYLIKYLKKLKNSIKRLLIYEIIWIQNLV